MMVIKTGIGDQTTKPHERPDGYIYPTQNVNKKGTKKHVGLLTFDRYTRYDTQHFDHGVIEGPADLYATQVAFALELDPTLGHFCKV